MIVTLALGSFLGLGFLTGEWKLLFIGVGVLVGIYLCIWWIEAAANLLSQEDKGMDYWLGILGTATFLDGIYSILYYCSDDRSERFWRNHIFRVFRSVIGLILIGMGFLL